jgi:hypothetical protein
MMIEKLVGETEVLGEKPRPVPLFPPQTTHALTGSEPWPPWWETSE